MKKYLYTMAFLAIAGSAMQAQEFDDIYYNPKTDNTQAAAEKKSKKSNYIKDFSSIDVDQYNRRGQYYDSPVDTIGAQAEVGEDFVYTQKIQKFYNPTIVVENADVLADVIDNSYGNVNIVFDNGLPYFNSIYGWPGYYNSYVWMPSWRWGGSFSWSYSPVWGFEYWPAWSIGPSWAWGPSVSWNWGYAPCWGPAWDWSWGWGWGPTWIRPFYGDYRPYGRQPNYPGGYWANNTRPGGNAARPSGSRPGYAGVSNNKKGVATNYHRTYSFGDTSASNRANASASTYNKRSTYTVGSDGHRRYGSSSTGSSSNHRTSSYSDRSSYSTSNNNSYNHSSSRSSSSYNSGNSRSSSYSSGSRSSSGSSRSSGGSYGGGRTSGGSGRGRR